MDIKNVTISDYMALVTRMHENITFITRTNDVSNLDELCSELLRDVHDLHDIRQVLIQVTEEVNKC